jgi:hypothetical protein
MVKIVLHLIVFRQTCQIGGLHGQQIVYRSPSDAHHPQSAKKLRPTTPTSFLKENRLEAGQQSDPFVGDLSEVWNHFIYFDFLVYCLDI